MGNNPGLVSVASCEAILRPVQDPCHPRNPWSILGAVKLPPCNKRTGPRKIKVRRLTRPANQLCLNFDRHVSTATKSCLRIHQKRVSAAMNAHFVRLASKRSSSMCAQTVAEVSFRDLFARRRTGKGITISEKTQRVPRSSIGLLIPQPMPSLRRVSERFRRKNDDSESMSPSPNRSSADSFRSPDRASIAV